MALAKILKPRINDLYYNLSENIPIKIAPNKLPK